MITLNKDIIELDYSSRTQLDVDQMVGGIIIPATVGNGITKTTVCKIKNLHKNVEDKLNIHVGDEILVDRYAIIQISKGLSEFNAFIRPDSVIMVKTHNAD
jgi:co-chaperonin GroES (HSP10)